MERFGHLRSGANSLFNRIPWRHVRRAVQFGLLAFFAMASSCKCPWDEVTGTGIDGNNDPIDNGLPNATFTLTMKGNFTGSAAGEIWGFVGDGLTQRSNVTTHSDHAMLCSMQNGGTSTCQLTVPKGKTLTLMFRDLDQGTPNLLGSQGGIHDPPMSATDTIYSTLQLLDWSNRCTPSELASCSIKITKDTAVTANFKMLRTLGRIQQGYGLVQQTLTAGPPLLDLPLATNPHIGETPALLGAQPIFQPKLIYLSRYRPGTVITLNAIEQGTVKFIRWEGACTGTAKTCVVVFDSTTAHRTYSAFFEYYDCGNGNSRDNNTLGNCTLVKP